MGRDISLSGQGVTRGDWDGRGPIGSRWGIFGGGPSIGKEGKEVGLVGAIWGLGATSRGGRR